MFKNKYKNKIENKIAELVKAVVAIEKEYHGVKQSIEPEKYCHYWVLRKNLEDDIKLLKDLL